MGRTGSRTAADRTTSLLLKAIRQLPEREQDVLLRHFVGLGIGTEAEWVGNPGDLPAFQFVASGPARWGPIREGIQAAGSQSLGAAQVVPVRLPDAQYRRLKDWCQQHNFAMAVAIRGLADPF